MVELGEKKKDSGFANDRAQPDGARQAGGGGYTASDAAQFERLVDGLRRYEAAERRKPAPGPATPETSAFRYSDSDTRAFDRLMEDLTGSRGGRQGQTASQRRPGQGFGYTDADDHLFSDLMAEGRFPPGQRSSEADLSASERPAESAFEYTAQDKEAFRKILSGTQAATEDEAPEEGLHPSKKDRDVGPIKIVDFDKEHARTRAKRRRGAPNIKIRYFD